MPINSFLYPGASGPPSTYEVANSLRFNSGSNDNLTRSQSSGNRRTFTFSAWLKVADPAIGAAQIIMENYADTGNYFIFYVNNNPNQFSFFDYSSSATQLQFNATQDIRDPAAWYHVVVAIDTTQSTESNRVKFYINGSQVTVFDTANYPSQNLQTNVNNGNNHMLGRWGSQNGFTFDGYMAEVVFIDGQALDPTSFGEFDSDSPTIWKPIDVSGLTFGTNGYYLDFENSSALGADVSGNSNNFTVNNLQSLDQSTDTCTNNFCTWNPLIIRTGRTAVTFSEGNLKAQHNDTGGNTPSWGTFLLNSGKWYWEVKITSAGIIYCGVWQPRYNNGDVDDALNGIVVYRTDGNKQAETAATAASYGDSFTTGDILGIAVDVDTGTIWFSKNGTWQNSVTQSEIEAGTTTNSAFTGKSFATNGIVPAVSAYQQSGNAIVEANFGGGTSFTISSGNADANGYGNFEYPVPSGFYSINSKNLAEFG